MGQTLNKTDSVAVENVSGKTPSDFYQACRNGDVEAVRQMLTELNTADINRLEPNGSTSLHAASYYNHKVIVQMLLEHGAEPWIPNKYQMTPYEEAANDEIRSLFRRPSEANTNRFVDDDTDTHCLGVISEKETDEILENIPDDKINGYKNIGKNVRSKNVKHIVRAQISKYYLTQLQKRSSDCARELQSILKQNVLPHHCAYKTARFLFDQYCSRNQIEYLIRLYTLETDFYDALHSNVEPFAVEIYSQLSALKDRFFQGQSYRGLSMKSKDIEEYRWAARNQGNFIEMKTLTSTSVDPQVASDFARKKKTDNKNSHRVFCQFQFDRQCSTAIDLRRNDAKKLCCLSAYEDEAEVLVLPGTLFEVRDIVQAPDTGRYTITLNNVYVPFSVISEVCKEAEA